MLFKSFVVVVVCRLQLSRGARLSEAQLSSFSRYREAIFEFVDPPSKTVAKKGKDGAEDDSEEDLFAHLSPLNVTLRLKEDTSFFEAGYKEIEVDDNDTATITRDGPPHCFYRGDAFDDDSELVGQFFLSTCSDNFRGALKTFNRSYELHFAKEIDQYVLVDLEDFEADKSFLFFDGIDDKTNISSRRLSNRQLSANECQSKPDKYAKIVIFNDFDMRQSFDNAESMFEYAAMAFGYMRDIYFDSPSSVFKANGDMGLFDPQFINCKFQPLIAGQVSYSNGNPSVLRDCGTDASCLLRAFAKLELVTNRQSSLDAFNLDYIDNALLMSGIDFAGSTVGVAYVGAMCSPTASASVNSIAPSMRTLVVGASVLAHELGHNIGMPHDSSSSSYLMAPTVRGNPSGNNIRFSDTSKAKANDYFENVYDRYSNRPRCLDDSPSSTTTTPSPSPAPNAQPISPAAAAVFELRGSSVQKSRHGKYADIGVCEGLPIYECVEGCGSAVKMWYKSTRWQVGTRGCGKWVSGVRATVNAPSTPLATGDNWQEYDGTSWSANANIEVFYKITWTGSTSQTYREGTYDRDGTCNSLPFFTCTDCSSSSTQRLGYEPRYSAWILSRDWNNCRTDTGGAVFFTNSPQSPIDAKNNWQEAIAGTFQPNANINVQLIEL